MPHVWTLLREELFKLSDTPVSFLSIIIFLVGISTTITVGRFARSAVTRYLDKRRGATTPGISYAVGRIVQYVVVVAGTFVCVDTLGLDLGTLAALGAMLSVGVGF